MRFKEFILLREETFVYTIPVDVTPRVKNDIELISWKASITTTDYNTETIEDIKDSIFYINCKKQIRVNKNSYYDEQGRKCEKEELVTAIDEVYVPGWKRISWVVT